MSQASSPDNKDNEVIVADSDLKQEDIEGEGDPNGTPLRSVKKESKNKYENSLNVVQELEEEVKELNQRENNYFNAHHFEDLRVQNEIEELEKKLSENI